MLESFVLRWGYLAIGVGTFFEGEAILLAGGAIAHRGLLSLPLVMIAAFVGSVVGDQLWFFGDGLSKLSSLLLLRVVRSFGLRYCHRQEKGSFLDEPL